MPEIVKEFVLRKLIGAPVKKVTLYLTSLYSGTLLHCIQVRGRGGEHLGAHREPRLRGQDQDLRSGLQEERRQEGGREEEVGGRQQQEGRAQGQEEGQGQGRQQTPGVRQGPDSREDHRGHQRPRGALLPHQVEGWVTVGIVLSKRSYVIDPEDTEILRY